MPQGKLVEAVSLTVAEDAGAAEEILDQLIAHPGKSSAILLKDPAAASHPSWHLWLPPHFNSALDLRFMQKQKTKNKTVVQIWKEWVQGGRFQFNEGSIIYDRDVSALNTWGEKLRAVDVYLQIHSARPVSSKIISDEQTGLKTMIRDPGLVGFDVYRKASAARHEPPERISMTQDGFLRYAITGRR